MSKLVTLAFVIPAFLSPVAASADYLPNPDDMTRHIDRTGNVQQQIASVGICLKVRGIEYKVMQGYTGTDIVVFGGAKASSDTKAHIDECFK